MIEFPFVKSFKNEIQLVFLQLDSLCVFAPIQSVLISRISCLIYKYAQREQSIFIYIQCPQSNLLYSIRPPVAGRLPKSNKAIVSNPNGAIHLVSDCLWSTRTQITWISFFTTFGFCLLPYLPHQLYLSFLFSDSDWR